MKREIKIIGIKPYQTVYNGNTYVGTKYYYIFNEDGCDGNSCDSFKIPFNRANDFPRVSVNDEYTAYLERTQNGVRVDELRALK